MTNRTNDVEQRVEDALRDFERKRDVIGEEILRIKADTIKYVEDIFFQLESSLISKTSEVDRNIDSSIDDLRKLIAKKRELDQFMDRLTPVVQSLTRETSREVKKTAF